MPFYKCKAAQALPKAMKCSGFQLAAGAVLMRGRMDIAIKK